MTSQLEQNDSPRTGRSRRRGVGWTIRITPTGLILLLVINLIILGGLAYGISRIVPQLSSLTSNASITPGTTRLAIATTADLLPTDTQTNPPSVTSTAQPSETSTPQQPTNSPQPVSTLSFDQGLLILALDEGGNTHLFAYQPEIAGTGEALPLTRMTYGPWDDITPAISPDGQTVAFASNRSGYWDIYLMNLGNAGITRLTDTLAYEAAPSWSPDGQWLAYEAYIDNNLEIIAQPINSPGELVRLTNRGSAEFSPAWSPKGRQIAFVSNQTGDDEVWLADLDKSEDQRFQNFSSNPLGNDTHPAWAPDGSALVWVGEQDGIRSVRLNPLSASGEPVGTPVVVNSQIIGSGDWPVWSADGEAILTTIEMPNRVYLTAFTVREHGLSLPAIELPGAVHGLSWTDQPFSASLQSIYQQAAQATSTPLYDLATTTAPTGNGGRYPLEVLDGVEAPDPYLHNLTADSFAALKVHIANELGWDYLAKLENAYLPLTTPLAPEMGNDWLYTGRAFTVNTLPMNAGWMVVVREDFGSDTYWRVYVRALYQDGSAGMPLHDLPWDFDARYDGNTLLYEQGGTQLTSIPAGYWIDFTERARSYGWERLPALISWRAFYPGARFNEFVSTGGLPWKTAMLQLYPAEALITPTAVIPPTRTPTPTLRWYVSPTPTLTPTPRPTYTPSGTTPALPSNSGITSTSLSDR